MDKINALPKCPKCNYNGVLTIDMGIPPRLFECGRCSHRFHSVGFQLSEVDAGASLSMDNTNVLAGILKKTL